jgi:ABC-type multidrug transport system ATPase subunit
VHRAWRKRFLPSFIIEADRLVKFYGRAKEPALDELGLKVPEGKIFTLLGRNGAGKTTFLRIATTQLLPTSRRVQARTHHRVVRNLCHIHGS